MIKPKRFAIAFALLMLAMLPAGIQAQDAQDAPVPLPLSNSPSAAYASYHPMTFAQQRARFAEEQRAMRMEWNNWIGYSPLRPNMNASYMSNGLQRYYLPSRGVIVSAGPSSRWYW